MTATVKSLSDNGESSTIYLDYQRLCTLRACNSGKSLRPGHPYRTHTLYELDENSGSFDVNVSYDLLKALFTSVLSEQCYDFLTVSSATHIAG